MFLLSTFEQNVPTRVLERGEELYSVGSVKSLQNDKDFWFAEVRGSQLYNITIRVIDSNVIESKCDCPYDQGLICKHQVAVLLTIKANISRKQNSSGINRKIKSRPISLKERHTILFLEKGQIDVIDGSFVIIDKNGIRTHIPVGGIATLMLEPGTRISHAAIALAAETGCLILWTGNGGVRLYSAGQPGGARADRLLYQAKLALDESTRIKVVRAMYEYRFKEKAPAKRSIEQLRGIEGSRVRSLYKLLAKQYGVEWKGRNYNPKDWDESDLINRCLSTATHCLYGICEAAILAAGYAPAIGFIHTGKARSFVYDIADLFKFETVVPVAFKIAKEKNISHIRTTRIRCRNIFRETKILKNIIPTIEAILAAGGFEIPGRPKESVPVAVIDEKGLGDVGYRD